MPLPARDLVPAQLALQGGGAHGAVTWGVLDRLLEEERIEIRALSGTSAGAMNAVILADGLARGGREGARAGLAAFWRSVSATDAFSTFRRGPWARASGAQGLARSGGHLVLDMLSRFIAPRDINPLGINPLRSLLRHVDFARLNAPGAVAVHVAATDVRTGLARVFSPGELSLEAVLASACLPQFGAAIEIDGNHYWDGGFSANPALAPLSDAPAAPDLIIVALNAMHHDRVPEAARDIINRTGEITFNASLLGQLDSLRALRRENRREAARVRLHLIRSDAAGPGLADMSKFNVEWTSLTLRRDIGRRLADDWLATHGDALGRSETVDLDGLLGHMPPAAPAPAPRRGRLRALWSRLRAA